MPNTANLPPLSRNEQRAAGRASADRNDGRKLLNVGGAATYIGKSKWTVYRLIHSGELRAIRVGDRGTLRIRPGDLDAYLDRHVIS
jgi:excisionase family DNA binding protein